MRAGFAVVERGVRNKQTGRATKTRLPNDGTVVDVRRTTNPVRLREFRRSVWQYYRKNGRHDLPWRQTSDPYKILVSEVMLQQTQVPRVLTKYKSFLKIFPTVHVLAKAPLAEVLKEWSGLGYNRRAKYLHQAAKILATKKKLAADDFDDLPGVGPYTASAVKIFAFNQSAAVIETNIRTVFLHHFYSNVLKNMRISDRELLPIVQQAAKGQDPRTWYWALMDYGAYLKKSGVKNNHRSKHYTKQSKFEGSLRQVRGAILKELQGGRKSEEQLALNVGHRMSYIRKALEGLIKDGLVKKKGKSLAIP